MARSKVKGGFLTFRQARKAVRALGITSNKQYQAFDKKRLARERLPTNPHVTYGDQWAGWPYFLGTGPAKEPPPPTDRFVSFEEARQLVAKAKIRTCVEYWRRDTWRARKKLPRSPHVVYLRDWQGWGHFLGREPVATERIAELCEQAGIHTLTEYQTRLAWRRKHGLPAEPPDRDVLFPNSRAVKDIVSFDEARRVVRKLNITKSAQYLTLDLKTRLAHRLPGDPRKAYANQWSGWKYFLGTGPARLSAG